MHLAKIAIHELREPAQVARATIDTDQLDELAADIRANGVLQPLHVKEVDGGYEVVDGHRRLLAARRAGLVAVPCLLLSKKDASELIVKVHANLYRQEWTPVEEGAFYSEILPECGNDTDKLAALVGHTRGYVEGRLLLMQGDPDVLAAVAAREITLGVAEELNKLKRREDREEGLRWAKIGQMTLAQAKQFRVTRNLAADAAPTPADTAAPPSPSPTPARDPFECFICRKSEPKVGLEFWHIHSFCRMQVEANVRPEEPKAESREGQHEGPPARP